MKIAVLILAHKNPGQLRKLVDTLKTHFEVFIHFDKRCTVDQFFPDEEHVHILKNRFAPYWGSFNIVRAQLELLKEAHQHNCDYYMVISGQDLPLMSNDDIIDDIENRHLNYLDYSPLPRNGWASNGGMDRLTLYWETKYENNARLPPFTLYPYKAFFMLLRFFQSKLNLKRQLSFPLWGGAQWMCITKEAAQYIITFVAQNDWYIKRYRFTRISDEIFFHTILLSFDFPGKNQIFNDNRRYTDWKSGPQYPKVFIMEDYEKCINSGNFFGRKFDQEVDNEIIEKILKYVQSGPDLIER